MEQLFNFPAALGALADVDPSLEDTIVEETWHQGGAANVGDFDRARAAMTIRTIFVSDVHLGCRHANSEALLTFLRGKRPRFLYLVGDFIDGWKLKRNWYWNSAHSELIRRVVEMSRAGVKVFYAPGNHDEFLRSFTLDLGGIAIADEFIHAGADGRRYLVTHGDRFDSFEQRMRWLSKIGDVGYEILLRVNRWTNQFRRRLGRESLPLSLWVKRRVKAFTCFVCDFEKLISQHAQSKGCDGIICGHVHTPAIADRGGVTYCNTGDWVESCSALVEYEDGRLELQYHT